MSAIAATRNAVIARLKTMPYPVFDGVVPADHVPSYPYLVVPESIETNNPASFNRMGADHVFTVRVWSTARKENKWLGNTEIATVMDQIAATVMAETLVVMGHRVRKLKKEISSIVPQPEQNVVSGTVQFRALTHPS